MNILLCGCNYDAGFKALKRAVEANHPTSRVLSFLSTSKGPEVGSYLTQNDWKSVSPTRVEPNVERFNLSPIEIVHYAFYNAKEYIPIGRQWDIIYLGLSKKAAVGTLEIMSNAYSCAAMVASMIYDVPAIAIHQDETDTTITSSMRHLEKFIAEFPPQAGECWNVNFPRAEIPRAAYRAPVALFDSRRQEWTKRPFTPDDDFDVGMLEKGYITISELQMRVIPAAGF